MGASKAAPRSWFQFGSGKSGVVFSLGFPSGQRFRIEVYIDTSDLERNAAIFDALFHEREPIEQAIGEPLEWDPLENRRAKRISLYAPYVVSIDSQEEVLQELIEWAIPSTIKFVEVFRPHLRSHAP
jgi:hypothetical protein